MNKQHILEEIKRTAEANGGIPLGRSRFFQETGIKEYDWLGKLWVRWSDAVKEAGFAPNKMTAAYNDKVLIEKLIVLMRELGHFPIAPDIRIKAYNDKSFPNLKTFERWGSKAQRATNIVEYCKQDTGYEDVLAMCETVLLESQQLSKEEENIPDNLTTGYVYLIKSGRYYKIGRSNAVGRREYELNIQLPEKTETLHAISTDDPVGIEAYWHKRFENKHKNGEWFELTIVDVNIFKRRKFM